MQLPLRRPWAWALAACAAAAAAEGALAGPDVGLRLSQLLQPRLSPPLWAWAVIGAGYYVLFFFVLESLLAAPPTPPLTAIALVLVGLLLAANSAWNWVFFRQEDLALIAVPFVPYVGVALALGGLLFRLRSRMVPWYSLYLVYLIYAVWWTFAVWRLNPTRVPGAEP
jgi:tryptophan-rich sensory protein